MTKRMSGYDAFLKLADIREDFLDEAYLPALIPAVTPPPKKRLLAPLWAFLGSHAVAASVCGVLALGVITAGIALTPLNPFRDPPPATEPPTEETASEPSEETAESTEAATEEAVDPSSLSPAELYEYARKVTEAQNACQMTVSGSVEMTVQSGETTTYPLSLALSRYGALSHVLMTDPDGSAREMIYSDGYLYWYENGECLRIQLNENRVAAMVGALDYSFQVTPGGFSMDDYTLYPNEFPAVNTLFSSITATRNDGSAEGEPAYTVSMRDAIPGKKGRFFFANSMESMSVTASLLADGRLDGLTIEGVWSNTMEEYSYFYILPILADTLGLEPETQGKYTAMTWSLTVDFSYEAEPVPAPRLSEEDVHLTWFEVMGEHHVIPFADITISDKRYGTNLLSSETTLCVVTAQAKEGETLSREDRALCWIIYRIEDGKETPIVTYEGVTRRTDSLGDSYSDGHPLGKPTNTYLPLEAGDYKLVLHYVYIGKTGLTFEERWDLAGVTSFRVLDKDELSQRNGAP